VYSNLKIVPLLIERETPCSLFSDESPKREKKESLFVREEKTHFTTLSLSLSVCVCVLLPRSSLCVVSARSFSLFSLNLITKERMERKMKRERRSAILPFVLKPYTLNSFFLQM
jgi:hypothetical protein